MRSHACGARALRSGCLLAVLAGMPAAAQYSPGFEWSRQADWVPGVRQDSRENNPGSDAIGSAVWAYEVASGKGKGWDEPWYGGETAHMTWDELWWFSGKGAWSRGDNANPPAFQNRITHNLGPANIDNIPMIRWINPVGDGAQVNITGSLRVLWTGAEFVGAPTDVDVVIAFFDASTGGVTPLLNSRVSKPFDGLSIGDSVDVEVNLLQVNLDEGDSIGITVRGHDVLPGHWIDLHDTGLRVMLVPAPHAGAIAAIGVLAVAGRRRRR